MVNTNYIGIKIYLQYTRIESNLESQKFFQQLSERSTSITHGNSIIESTMLLPHKHLHFHKVITKIQYFYKNLSPK